MISKRTAAVIDISLMIVLIGVLVWFKGYVLAALLSAAWGVGVMITIRKNKKIQ